MTNEVASNIQNLKLQLIAETKDSSVSELTHEGKHICYVIENGFRPAKIYGETRIPGGLYKLFRRKSGGFFGRYSKRFKHGFVVGFTSVPDFTYILFHIGNSHKDTKGCPLVNTEYFLDHTGNYRGIGSVDAYLDFYKLCKRLFKQGELYVEIVRELHVTDNEPVPEVKEPEEPVFEEPVAEEPATEEPALEEPKQEQEKEQPKDQNKGCLGSLLSIFTMRFTTILLFLCFATSLVKGQNYCGNPPAKVDLPPVAYSAPDPNLNYSMVVKIEVDFPFVLANGIDVAQQKVNDRLHAVEQIYKYWAMFHYNIDLCVEWDVFYWQTPSPYAGPSTGAFLNTYREEHQPHNGQVSQLLVFGSSGGIAYVGVECNDVFGVSVSNIFGTGIPDPFVYLWDVMVIAHELAHNYNCPHSHSCVWNGNNTAVDGCAGFTEGSCPIPPNPANGGSIMSYCHLISNVGINFAEVGFTAQEMAVILNSISGAYCANCDTPPPPPVTCEDNDVLVQVMPDAYPSETTWRLSTIEGQEIAVGGPYTKDQRWLIQEDSFCLVDGCYRFVIHDLDGLGGIEGQCDYSGAFYIQNEDNTLLSGIEFTDSMSVNFCLGDVDTPCDGIEFGEILSMGSSQDNGESEVLNDSTIHITGNAWKGIDLPYELTPNTILSFDVMIDVEGEIHGVGFYPNNTNIYFNNTIKIGGTQFWGNAAYQQDYELGEWVSYEIPIGQYYESVDLLGEYPYLVFVNDMDGGLRNASSFFRNVQLCEAYTGQLPKLKPAIMGTEAEPIASIEPLVDLGGNFIYPNPATDSTNLPFAADYKVFNVQGELMQQGFGDAFDTSYFPAGLYFVFYNGKMEKLIKR